MQLETDLLAGEAEAAAAEPVRAAQRTFEANLPFMLGVLHRLGARHRLSPAERERFSSYALERRTADGYALLRRFANRSTLRTYLVVVMCSLFLEYHDRRGDAYRPPPA